MTELFPHQRVGVERLARRIPTYLALDMGIGKSRTFIEAVKARDAKRVLVLCPATALLVWKREIHLWHKDATFVVVKTPADLVKPVRYVLVSHGLMSQKDGAVAEALIKGPPFEMTAIDEAQAYNASDSNRVNTLRRASPRLGDITPLSGTPMKNHAGELYTLLSICWPQGLRTPTKGYMTRTDFEDRFCRVTHKTFGGSRMIRVIEGSKNLDQLREIIAPFVLRVRKEDVFKDLPPILWDSVPVALDPVHLEGEDAARLFDTVGKAIIAQGPEAGLNAFTAAMNDFSEASLMTMRRLLGLAKLRGSIEYLVDMLDNLPENRKLLVFAHHAHVIASLARHLGEYSPAVIVGSTTQTGRADAVDRFLTDPRCRVFVGNILAAGTAITLVGPKCKCSDVVFVESSWTPMDNAQAACRVHRIGQKDGVVARMLSASGTIDDLINGLLVRKAREFTQLFDLKKQETT